MGPTKSHASSASPPRPLPSRPRPIKYRSACDNCHRLKVKCGQEKDSCARCSASGIECIYGISRRNGKPREVRERAAAAAAAGTQHLNTPDPDRDRRNSSISGYEADETGSGTSSDRRSRSVSQLSYQQYHQPENTAGLTHLPLYPITTLPPSDNDANMETLCFDDFTIDTDATDYLMTDNGSSDFVYGSPSNIDFGSPQPSFITVSPPPPPSQMNSTASTPAISRYSLTAENKHDYLNFLLDSMIPNISTADNEQFLDFDNKYLFLDLPQQLPPLTELMMNAQRSNLSAATASIIETSNAPPPRRGSKTVSSQTNTKATREIRSKTRCNHDSLVLEKFRTVENLLSGDNEQQISAFDQVLSLSNNIFPQTMTDQILSCPTCVQTSSSMLSFIMLVDKVLVVYQSFLEGSLPASSEPAKVLRQQYGVPGSMNFTSPPGFNRSESGRNFSNVNAGTYMAPSHEQNALTKMLLQSQLGRIQGLIGRIQMKVCNTREVRNVTEGMDRACQAATEHIRERLDAVFTDLDQWE